MTPRVPRPASPPDAPIPDTPPPPSFDAEGRFVPTHTVPFSETLDQLIAEIRAGNAPNLGHFCGHCNHPLPRTAALCRICGVETAVIEAVDKIDRRLAQIYTAKRKREGRWVHGAAWGGILLGTLISLGLIVLLPGWTKVFAVIFLILGSYYIASYLGNVAIQDWAYRRGLLTFAREWQAVRRERDAALPGPGNPA